MGIIGIGYETYLYINGISCNNEIPLRNNITLMPVNTKLPLDKLVNVVKTDIDFSIANLSSKTLSSQFKIVAKNPKELAILTWNAQWDCILLGAIFNCEVMCNLQCDKSVSEAQNATYVNVTNYKFHALLSQVYHISKADEGWLKKYYSTAIELMNNDIYRTAVHSMASYKWHSMPRIQLAIIWSGIESLFNVSTEVSFRISLYIARFLSENDDISANKIFQSTKKLYNIRSSAVHGNRFKEDNIHLTVNDSALLLRQLIIKCAEIGKLPDTNNLLFNLR